MLFSGFSSFCGCFSLWNFSLHLPKVFLMEFLSYRVGFLSRFKLAFFLKSDQIALAEE
jgi:hypothetical protein